MQRFRIFHETAYRYSNPVVLGPHKLLVRPRDGHDVRIEASKLNITPNAIVSWHRDELDNSVALVTFDQSPTTTLTITSEVTVAHYLSSREHLPLNDHVECFPFDYTELEQNLLSAYLSDDPGDPILDQWISELAVNKTHTVALLHDLSAAIYRQCTYQVRDEEGVQNPAETIAKKVGSCRDYAWLYVVAMRSLGFAARFVSGYFHTAGTALADGSTHAWAEVYLPGAGWTGFDPTCNRMTAENHIPVSVAVNPEDIPPVSGHFIGPVEENPNLLVRVNVNPC